MPRLVLNPNTTGSSRELTAIELTAIDHYLEVLSLIERIALSKNVAQLSLSTIFISAKHSLALLRENNGTHNKTFISTR